MQSVRNSSLLIFLILFSLLFSSTIWALDPYLNYKDEFGSENEHLFNPNIPKAEENQSHSEAPQVNDTKLNESKNEAETNSESNNFFDNYSTPPEEAYIDDTSYRDEEEELFDNQPPEVPNPHRSFAEISKKHNTSKSRELKTSRNFLQKTGDYYFFDRE